jgi:uncharacterized membrane protein YhhN
LTVTSIYLLTICLMVLDCYAVGTHRKGWRVFTKPAAMIGLIVWFSLAGHWQVELHWFGAALILSLLGDIFLLFPFLFFVAGLVAFSLAQVSYIVGLSVNRGFLDVSAILILVLVVVVAILDFEPIVRRIRSQRKMRKLLGSVVFYACLLSLMLFSAWLTIPRTNWNGMPSLFIVLGGSLFFISDSLLAREKFLRPVKFGGLLVMVTYFLGQLLLATGSVLHYAGGFG